MFVALILAAGVTALVAVGMMLVSLSRNARLTIGRGLLSGVMAVGVVAASVTGIVAVSAQPAQAQPADRTGAQIVDLQLPTR